MLSLAAVVGFSGLARASYDSIIGWMVTTLNPDLFMFPSESSSIGRFACPRRWRPSWTAIDG